MPSCSNHYKAIDEFFDAFSLPHALQMLARLIKTAGSGKLWKGACPANSIYFSERLHLLTEAVFSLHEEYDYRKEIVLDKGADVWMLNQYEIYCGWHYVSTPWDFFPRHLSKKEFTDPYKATKKFTNHHSLRKWKKIIEELCYHSLSPHSFTELDEETNIIDIWLHLHKLVEATHLISVRMTDDERKPRKKWKDREKLGEQTNNEPATVQQETINP